MGRTKVESGSDVLRADLDALRGYAALCDSTAADLDAVVTRAAAAASRLGGPGGCADAFRSKCDDAARRTLNMLRQAAEGVREDGSRLGRVVEALHGSDQESAAAIKRAWNG